MPDMLNKSTYSRHLIAPFNTNVRLSPESTNSARLFLYGCTMNRLVIISIVFLPLMGCGKRSQGVVSGTITYNGNPVNGVMLHLHPVSGEDNDISIPVNQEGKFSSANIPPGEYKIVVEAPKTNRMPAVPKGGDPAKAEEMKQKFQQAYQQKAPAIPYPDKYKTLQQTDLKCTITQNNPPLTLELK
jgi:hypothetical protein